MRPAPDFSTARRTVTLPAFARRPQGLPPCLSVFVSACPASGCDDLQFTHRPLAGEGAGGEAGGSGSATHFTRRKLLKNLDLRPIITYASLVSIAVPGRPGAYPAPAKTSGSD
jgi:hypothetical protein